jgi:3-hydroxyisobutyrate dehydrogenase-like beta-hydroxyacid dehydrogenase
MELQSATKIGWVGESAPSHNIFFPYLRLTSLYPLFTFLGLGSMGLGMAINLHKYITNNSMPPLSYTNRTLSRGDPLRALGAISKPTISELVRSSDIIFSSVSDDDVLLSLIDNMVASNDIRGKIFADTSTVHPKSAAEAASKLSAAGATFIATPVFGASPAATAGNVLFVVAGPTDAVTQILPMLKAMGRKIITVGTDPPKALLMKTTSNFLMAGLMELVAEAHVFAEKTGLASSAFEELLQENFGTVIYNDSLRMTTGIYAPPKGKRPWSEVGLAIKDVTHGINLAEESGCRLLVGELALKHLKEAKEWGDAAQRVLDSTSIYGIVRKEAGLDFESEVVKTNNST